MSVPNMDKKQVNDFFLEDFHIMNLLYDNSQLDPTPPPFNYFKYMGSMTSPPCEEYVVHFVVHHPIHIGTTLVNQLREGLDYPDDNSTPQHLRKHIDGSNRKVQPLNKREVLYFDREKSCNPYTPKSSDGQGHWERSDR